MGEQRAFIASREPTVMSSKWELRVRGQSHLDRGSDGVATLAQLNFCPPQKKGKNKTHCVDLFTPLAAFLFFFFFWLICALSRRARREKAKNNRERNTSHDAIRLVTSAAGGGYRVKKLCNGTSVTYWVAPAAAQSQKHHH